MEIGELKWRYEFGTQSLKVLLLHEGSLYMAYRNLWKTIALMNLYYYLFYTEISDRF